MKHAGVADEKCAAYSPAFHFPCLQYKSTPLHCAAHSSSKEAYKACRVLIENGADVNARDKVMRVREGVREREGLVERGIGAGVR